MTQRTANFWVEKTYIEGRGVEQHDSFGFSNSLWSPLTSIDGKEIYQNMKSVKKNDVILHLAKEKPESPEPFTLRGVSVVSKEAEIFDMPPNTKWGDKWREKGLDPKGYIIRLSAYTELKKHVSINEFLKSPKYANKLMELLESESDLFYNRLLRPNQSKYLTRAPIELVLLLDEFYYSKTSKHLPHIDVKPKKELTSHQGESFAFTEKDFALCMERSRKNSEALKRRIQEFTKVLNSHLGEEFRQLRWRKKARGAYRSPYIPNIREERGKGPYRNYMWVGFAHEKYERTPDGVQLQFSIDKDGVWLEIWIDKRVKSKVKSNVRKNIEANLEDFLANIKRPALSNCNLNLDNGDKLKREAPQVDKSFLQDFLENMEKRLHVSLSRNIPKKEVIEMGPKIVAKTVQTFTEFLPVYYIMIGERQPLPPPTLELEDKIAITHLIMGRNIIFYGPPGTGKTRKAKALVELFCGKENYLLQTGNAEWTVYDVVGGPTMNNRFKPGFLSVAVKKCNKQLEEHKRPLWLILDELNRANLDLGFGKIFTLLDLDYRKVQCVIDNNDVEGLVNAEDWMGLLMPPEFRILATMNSYDRALLFSLGFAFRRRFAFVEVPSPFKESDFQKFELRDDVWNEELAKIKGKFEDVMKNIKLEIEKKWINEGNFLSLPLSLKTAIGFSGNLKDKLEKVSRQILNGEFDPYNVFDISVKLANYVTENQIIDLGYAQPVDLIKFAITYLTLFPSEDPKKSIVEAMDEAVKAYFIPQIEYFLPKVRREMAISEEEGEIQKEKLESLIEYLRNLGLIKSAYKLENAKEQLKFGEIRIL